MSLLSEFLVTGFANNRSSHRTDLLHSAVLEEYLVQHPGHSNLDWSYEQKIEDAYGGTFKVDIVGRNSSGDNIVGICAKAINSNFAQNIKNYANTTVGESVRILMGPAAETLEKVVFFTVHPMFAPYFKSNGTKSRVEDVMRSKSRCDIGPAIHALHGDIVELMCYTYNIAEVSEYTTKADFQSGITVLNLERND